MSRASLGWWALCAGALLLVAPRPAGAQSPEERRRQLQERLGIKKPGGQATQSPDAGVPAPGQGEVPPTVTAPGPAATKEKPPPGAARPHVPTFAEDARPILEKACAECHRPGGKAEDSKWVLRGGPGDYEETLRFVKLDAPAQSKLLRKGSGQALHEGETALAADSAGYGTLLRWIEGGALPGKVKGASTPAPVAQAGTPPAGGRPAAGATTSAPPGGAPPQVAPPGTIAGAPAPPAPAGEAAAAGPGPLRFAPRVHELLLSGCASCHAPDKLAASSRYQTSPDPQRHLESALPQVVPGSAAKSALYERARGVEHKGEAIWEPGSPELALLAQWIDGGALGPEQPPAQAGAAVPAAAAAATPPAAQTGAPPAGGMTLGTFPLLGTLRVGGRFDLNYERAGYHDHPFQRATNALRSYHQFLFLTRQSTEDPVTLSLELLSLQFWEIGARISPDAWPVKVSAKLGKVLVPFGGEPLFHHSYGGHAGFDQKVLPPVFSREGLTVNAQRRLGPFALSADAYVIAGYRLRRADAVLNLQSDFAPLEETRLGAGGRLGASWGPISAWYSPYFNSLGFGRLLFLQALDVAVWRPRGLLGHGPLRLLEHFSLGAGLLRADISGGAAEGYGGVGADYFHFASYFQLRYHPADWLYVQYRQGLRTFNNRSGLILDTTSLTREDGSTHNVGVVARWKGLTAGLYLYWNLEKADEVPDDFTRLVVAYEF